MSITLKGILTSLLVLTPHVPSHRDTSRCRVQEEAGPPISQRPGRWQRWRTRRQLRELTDRELRDIGLTRTEARREVLGAFWR